MTNQDHSQDMAARIAADREFFAVFGLHPSEDWIIENLIKIDAAEAETAARKLQLLTEINLAPGQRVSAKGWGWHHDTHFTDPVFEMILDQWVVLSAEWDSRVNKTVITLGPVDGDHYALVWPEQIVR